MTLTRSNSRTVTLPVALTLDPKHFGIISMSYLAKVGHFNFARKGHYNFALTGLAASLPTRSTGRCAAAQLPPRRRLFAAATTRPATAAARLCRRGASQHRTRRAAGLFIEARRLQAAQILLPQRVLATAQLVQIIPAEDAG